MIRYDRAEASILAVCHYPGCSWRALRTTQPAATVAATTHEANCHPNQFRARHAAQMAQIREK